jgi:hypothetical protein
MPHKLSFRASWGIEDKVMKRLLLIIVVAIAAYAGYVQHCPRLFDASAAEANRSDSVLANAFSNHLSNIRVQGEGVVSKVLTDDNDGSRHQRFIIRLASGQTILFAHNIDIAPRVASLRQGDTVSFNGVYVWNAKGGVVHWTHRDPSRRHPAGWLKHNGQTFQ